METLDLTQTPDSSQSQVDEGTPTQAPAVDPAGQNANPAEPTGLDKLRQKGAVAPSLAEKKPALPGEAPAAPAYQPNFKFKAMGKEHEIPELLRGAIKDKESEKFVHDLFEKAYGLTPIKERLQETRQELQQTRGNLEYVMGNIQEAQEAYRRGDLDTVFEVFKVAPEKVLQWAVNKVQLSQMPPEQRQALEEKRAAERRIREMEKQSHHTSQEFEQQQSQHLSQMLELVLERQDISAVAQAYDTRKAQPGAFRALVVRMGQAEAALSGKTLSPLEAAQKAIELLGEQAPAAAPQAPVVEQATNNAPQPQATPAATQPKKTIPNLANAGSKAGASPAKPKVKSIDDIKRKYDEIAAGGSR